MSPLSETAERGLAMVEDQRWLDTPSYKFENALALLTGLLGDRARPVLNLLHGTWLGHPLHAALTDVPVGAWTAAFVLDTADAVSPRAAGFRDAARMCVGAGLVGATGAAAAGLADWQYTQDNARRVGVVHGMLNVAATGLYLASWVDRRRGRYQRGRRASGLGYGVVLVSAYLGGSLVSRHRVGVDHADRRLVPRQFVTALRDGDLLEGQPVRVEVEGVSVLLVRSAGRVHAVGEECSHLGGPLAQGWIRGGSIVCPWHGSSFDVSTGHVRSGPATCPLPSFQTRVLDGQIQVRCRPSSPAAPPGSVVAREQAREQARERGHADARH